jgi:hypothetical protein
MAMLDPTHPTHDTWELLATGELAAAERKLVMAHVVGCPACARTWRVVKDIAREARSFDPGVPATAPDEPGAQIVPLRRVRRALFAGGVAALVAAAVLLLWVRGGSMVPDSPAGDPGLVRGGSGEQEVVLVTAAGARLAWRPVQNAQHYRVEVFSRDGALVWSRDEITATTVDVAPPLPPADYRWHVEAWVGGSRIAVSRPARFTVAP